MTRPRSLLSTQTQRSSRTLGSQTACQSTPSDASQFVVLESELDGAEQQRIDGTDTKDTRVRVLSTLSLLALCFFSICAGPIGAETVITAGGPAIGLLALVVFPIVFYIPMCFMVTELISAIPAAGGHAYWIALAFGPQYGFQAGYWSWVSNCVNCSLVSSMAVALFAQNSKGEHRSVTEEVFRQGLPLLLAMPGFLSLRRVGQIVSLLFACVIGMFIVLAVCGAATAHNWGDLTDFRSVNATAAPEVTARSLNVDIAPLVTNLIWSFHGFHNLSVFATEVPHPVATYRRVMYFAIVLIPLTYLLPMAVAVAASDPKWTEWERNAIGDILLSFGGTSKDALVGILLACSVVGLYLTGLTSSAFLATGMVAKRFGPPGFASSSAKQTTPHSAIFASLPVMLIIVNIECSDMIRIANALGGLCSITLILAAIRLRFIRSGLPRPTKLCGDLHPAFMVAALLIPVASLAYATVTAFATVVSAVLTTVFIVIGLVYGQRGTFTNFDDGEVGLQ